MSEKARRLLPSEMESSEGEGGPFLGLRLPSPRSGVWREGRSYQGLQLLGCGKRLTSKINMHGEEWAPLAQQVAVILIT